MRLNIYQEEITNEVALVSKTTEAGRTFYGARVFLASAPELHHTEDDDDRSAVTFWVGKKSDAHKLVVRLPGLLMGALRD